MFISKIWREAKRCPVAVHDSRMVARDMEKSDNSVTSKPVV
jgi:hypothetical protein